MAPTVTFQARFIQLFPQVEWVAVKPTGVLGGTIQAEATVPEYGEEFGELPAVFEATTTYV